MVIVGAGHAGLAASYCLAHEGIDHVVLERGEVANSWRHERWDSLTLLTPNWQSRLPGQAYEGEDPDGFMSMPELIAFLDSYAAGIKAPIHTGTAVTELAQAAGGYRARADGRDWHSRAVIVASGACNRPNLPPCATGVPAGIASLTPFDYQAPDSLPDGGVLVVGASATGLQLADEILRSQRAVTIATGEQVRLPRTYRGRDIQWWMDAAGILDEDYRQIDDLNRARHLPSPQLVGSHERQILDLNALTDQGAGLVGKLMGFRDGVAQFSGSLRNVCALADLKMNRLLDEIDQWASEQAWADRLPSPERFQGTRVDDDPCLTLDLDRAGIRSILWCTGFEPDYSWLQVPVLDRKGMIRHDGGVADMPGLYVLGLPFLRRRKSSFIHGIEDDLRELVPHLAAYLAAK